MSDHHRPGRCAIVTAVSPGFWNDYLIFHDSIRRHSFCEVVVVSLELTSEQEEYIRTRQTNVRCLIPDPIAIKELKTIGNRWRQWYKPHMIWLVDDVNHLLWLDVDTVILGNPDELFIEAVKNFFVVADYFSPEGCRNNPKLYEAIPAPVPPEQENMALNSGVIGFSFPRDRHILELWLNNVRFIHRRPDLQRYVSLYDQGVLLLTLRQLGMMDSIKTNMAWNYPAKRNLYEMVTPSNSRHPGDYRWPQPHIPRIGGDIHDNIRLDNPGVLVAHYAGLPKLSHLCEVDHNYTVASYHHKHKTLGTRLVLVVGLERAGTHTIAEVLRRSCRIESWVRHEHRPVLAYEALQKYRGDEYRTKAFLDRLRLFGRIDCGLVCEANHRLGFFIDDIYEYHKDRCKFILLVRDPVDLIRSRLFNFAVWPNIIHKYPCSYQMDYYALPMTFGPGSAEQNQYRICPNNYREMDILDLHLWEVCHTIDVIMSHFNKLPVQAYYVLWIEHLENEIHQLAQFIGGNIIIPSEARKAACIRFGARQRVHSEMTVEWINGLVNDNRVTISRTIMNTMLKYGIRLPFTGV